MKVHIVGGGLAGLLSAAELRRRGHDVVLSEAGPDVGGIAQTELVDDAAGRWLLEPAAGSFLLPHPVLSPIVAAAGSDVILAGTSHERYLSNGSGFRRLPGGPVDLVRTPIVGANAKIRALAEPAVRSRTGPDETLHEFLTRRLGRQAGTLAAHLAASGVFAGDPTRLSASAFPQLVGLESESGSLLRGLIRARRARRQVSPGRAPAPRPTLHVPRHGMGQFVRQLAAFIGAVRTNAEVKSIEPRDEGLLVDGEPADAVVLASGPTTAPEYAGRPLGLAVPPEAQVAVAFLGGPRGDMHLPAGFGLLTGPAAATPILGVLFESAPGRAPEGHQLAKVLVGGARHAEALELDDHRLITNVVDDVGRILGASIRPTFTRLYRAAIPQYTPEHLAQVGGQALPDRVLTTGWTGRAIGVGSLAVEAGKIARTLEGTIV